MPDPLALDVPVTYQEFRDAWARDRDRLVEAYAQGRVSFLPNLLPEMAGQMPATETLRILSACLGRRVDLAMEQAASDGAAPLPDSLQGPVAGRPDGAWLKASNTTGINVRTIGSFWNVVKYVLTLPAALDSIHLLPIWEPGVVASLYGMSSWKINAEFFSPELSQVCPELDAVERQLAFVVHVLHAMGRTVGLDVIPHTDRFSQIVLSHPAYFEWLRREGDRIADHSANLHCEAEEAILAFLSAHGPAAGAAHASPPTAEEFFRALSEEARLHALFGEAQDRAGRERRRLLLVHHLNSLGLEPVPATMAPPYRGIEVDPRTRSVDSDGNVWYDYYITRPEPMSRVFGPLARYKLYESLEDNADWAIDFSRPRPEVWRYVCGHYAAVQHRFGFDFMRGDMSHVQMRPEGVPAVADDAYDLLRAVKRTIQVERRVVHFGYFAESFLAPRDVMGYGDEVDHLEASEADTLGDLQSTVVGSPEFLQRLRRYHDLATARRAVPSFTTITGDKDDPRFDAFYLAGNALRLFMALFLGDMPSYTALGFETRDPHPHPAPNEHYTKLYVFHEVDGPKATRGPYVWGRNAALFAQVTRLRLFAEHVVPRIRGRATCWLIAPDATAHHRHLAWTQADDRPDYLFVANTDTATALGPFDVPLPPGLSGAETLELELSTEESGFAAQTVAFTGRGYRVMGLAAAEGRAYRIRRAGGTAAQSTGGKSREAG